ncbi:hypothetical protein [Erwinia tasmaniensis]|uniref:hypothetical protein n=1 Tax=Erwinia tasmaniensis TaxID=338565 RepID=UPI001E3B4EA7|nr:hypothetical protein [Erwinia tasmaniensis]
MNWFSMLLMLFFLLACLFFYFKNKKSTVDKTKSIENSVSNNGTQLEKVVDVLNRTEAGILKRLDENRELLELLYSDAPELMKQKPWIRGWLESQDVFLVKVAEAVNVPTKGDSIHPYPRPFPLRVSDCDKEQGL